MNRFEEYWRPGWEGAKENFKPGLIVQTLILLMVVSYYSFPAVHQALEQIAGVRNTTGLVSSFILAAIMAGLVSEFLKWLTTPKDKWVRNSWKYYGFNILFWGCNGMVVDLFYMAQTEVFGTQRDMVTLLAKALADQFLFTLLFINNINCVAVSWRDSGFSWGKFVAELKGHYFKMRVVPAFVSNFCFWFPMVMIIYCMPYPLQMPTGALANTFWVLILNFVVNRRDLKNSATTV